MRTHGWLSFVTALVEMPPEGDLMPHLWVHTTYVPSWRWRWTEKGLWLLLEPLCVLWLFKELLQVHWAALADLPLYLRRCRTRRQTNPTCVQAAHALAKAAMYLVFGAIGAWCSQTAFSVQVPVLAFVLFAAGLSVWYAVAVYSGQSVWRVLNGYLLVYMGWLHCSVEYFVGRLDGHARIERSGAGGLDDGTSGSCSRL